MVCHKGQYHTGQWKTGPCDGVLSCALVNRHSEGVAGMTYLTVAEVAERLKVYPGTVKRWLRDGRLVGVSLGDRAGWRIAEADLERFLQSQRNVSPVSEEDPLLGKTAA